MNLFAKNNNQKCLSIILSIWNWHLNDLNDVLRSLQSTCVFGFVRARECVDVRACVYVARGGSLIHVLSINKIKKFQPTRRDSH